jgi:hypothetical protein
MQSALATTRPIKNRLFSLSLDLQALIYGYVDWEEDDYWPYRRGAKMFARFRPDILQKHMRYYWACQHDIALRGMPTIKNAPYYFCTFCESLTRREPHKISKINPNYAYYGAGTCTAMCDHLNAIRIGAQHYDYAELTPYKPQYKVLHARLYEKYFKDPDNKFDRDQYEEVCVAYPEKRLAYDYPCK